MMLLLIMGWPGSSVPKLDSAGMGPPAALGACADNKAAEFRRMRKAHNFIVPPPSSTTLFFLWCQLAELEGGLPKPPSIHLERETQ
jgi:hypothetical protein